MKKFVFSIDSKELIINANHILEAIAEIKVLREVLGTELNIEFIGMYNIV
ncbi:MULTISPECIES: hypothetical protein [Bacillaceae]|nr:MULTISPECIES: hypothetical protein [Bacillaceae]UGB32361.1 hypothetical protein LPC09_08005 [Metabacillus sp. B2-18]